MPQFYKTEIPFLLNPFSCTVTNQEIRCEMTPYFSDTWPVDGAVNFILFFFFYRIMVLDDFRPSHRKRRHFLLCLTCFLRNYNKPIYFIHQVACYVFYIEEDSWVAQLPWWCLSWAGQMYGSELRAILENGSQRSQDWRHLLQLSLSHRNIDLSIFSGVQRLQSVIYTTVFVAVRGKSYAMCGMFLNLLFKNLFFKLLQYVWHIEKVMGRCSAKFKRKGRGGKNCLVPGLPKPFVIGDKVLLMSRSIFSSWMVTNLGSSLSSLKEGSAIFFFLFFFYYIFLLGHKSIMHNL